MTSFVTDALNEQRKAREATQRLQLQAEAAWAKEEAKIASANARERAKQDRQTAREREVAAGHAEAEAVTRALQARLTELETLLASTLSEDPYVPFDQLKEPLLVTEFRPPEQLAMAAPAPQESDFMPEPLSGLGALAPGRSAGRRRAWPGGRAQGKKVLTGIAVEVSEPRGIGRCRMQILADGSAESLHPFVTSCVEPGAKVITDAWMGYHGLAGLGYAHERRSQRAARARGEDPGKLLPAVHRVASLAKRWLLSTHQGSVEEAHLQSYLDEFTFRFNRRRSRSRGLVFYRLLELAAGHDPVRYRDIVKRAYAAAVAQGRADYERAVAAHAQAEQRRR